ncbi:hypothetical protein F5Y08DRAFT_231893 [Xylaria arbuscula]|nr:hypothetical protein F5Y08DRAFT_231893 [Xylaria arbuscula]
MAEVLGTVVAGAQVVDYSLQIYDTINSIVNAARKSERYREIGEQLKEIIQKIRDSPHLQTPIILRCTDQLIATINDTHRGLCKHRRNQFLSSISFVMKQKKYDKLFDDIEQQKSTLALYISQLNTEKLGEISPTIDKIWIQLQRDSEQHETDSIIDEKGETTTSCQIGNHSQIEGKTHSSNLPKLALPEVETTPDDNSQKTSPAYSPPPMSSLATEFKGNTHSGSGVQTVGIQIGPGVSLTRETDVKILKATSNFRAHANVFTGQGTQVIGQFVQPGATPREFAGRYYNNHHKGSGDQVVGISFE